ncbi:uncharacterized protein LOC141695984 [Apium graveolens]|uniref:uncharacterized protein LOC141695984 n=1 Tax=Apium graveolens TaxID=4045 RepID=UPI003D7B5DC9
MANQQDSLTDLYAKLIIEDEEEEGMINVLSSIWRPKEGVKIHDLGDMRYSFVFYHPLDVQKVVEGGPCSFEQGMLVYKQIARVEDPKAVPLNKVDIWVQVYDVPNGFVSESIFQSIANYIGSFVKSDTTNLNGV